MTLFLSLILLFVMHHFTALTIRKFEEDQRKTILSKDKTSLRLKSYAHSTL